MNKNYTFFYTGPFSQWYPSKFTIFGIEFNTAEQWMMYQKAVFFGDTEIADKILKEFNPRNQKELGRLVKNFNVDKWNEVCKDIVYIGNSAKFTQNSKLFNCLMDTGNTILVDASPYDRIWGIGLGEDTAKNTPANEWPGKNWLGIVLTNLRDDLKKEIN